MAETLKVVKKPKTKIKIDLKPIVNEEKQVIVHCELVGTSAYRIWKTTYLVTEAKEKIPLIFWEGISLAPQWTFLPPSGKCVFTLIFKGLPSTCKTFSLIEEINLPGEFKVFGIKRNKTDVYHVRI